MNYGTNLEMSFSSMLLNSVVEWREIPEMMVMRRETETAQVTVLTLTNKEI
jgi:hypothetical protein